jgi:predicted aconitase with swiveling domain
MINKETETIVAVGAIISEIPFVDKIDLSKIKTGDKVTVKEDTVTIA